MYFGHRPSSTCPRAHAVRVLTAAFAVALGACHSDGVLGLDDHSQTRSVSVGDEVDVTLGNVGPAQYESPPGLSSNAVAFLSVDVVPPYTPAGPTQRFRFKAVTSGTAVVSFRRTLSGAVISMVEDTIHVR